MATYVLDTSVVSALMRRETDVQERLLREAPGDVKVPQPVVAEIEYGLARIGRSRRAAELRDRWLVLAGGLDRATWTDEVSAAFGAIKADLEHHGRRLDDFDVAIAAHAMALGATVVTRNTDHFARIEGLRVERW
jgi:tRNA(fMet)-specific endonuclease VapC